MDGEGHLSEQILNMYLDGELDSSEHARVEAHLVVCDRCRAEVAALRQLFVALDELAPIPDLVPGVLSRIKPRRRWSDVFARPGWLSAVVQLAVALGLLIWFWNRLAVYWATIRATLPLGSSWVYLFRWPVVQWLVDLAALSQWFTSRWTALSTWMGTMWDTTREWVTRLPAFGDARVSLVQVIVFGVLLAALWLVGNAVLLHRAMLNEQTIQTKRRI